VDDESEHNSPILPANKPVEPEPLQNQATSELDMRRLNEMEAQVLPEERAILPEEIPPVAANEKPEEDMPEEVPPVAANEKPEEEMPIGETSNADVPVSTPIDAGIPPAIPSSQIPSVNLLPPTPVTSQETIPATLLMVPDATPTSNPPASIVHRAGSRSRSPDPTAIRRSPRLASPASPVPPSKRPASDPLQEPAAKKPREK
jgi:hypothetical protein